MIIISHRGNLDGPVHEHENKPEYIKTALANGFDAEVDVWLQDDQLFLGHDKPQYKIEIRFLQTGGLWCHAKNIEAMDYMLDFSYINCFFHQNDDVTLTSRGYLWTFPGIKTVGKSICVLPEAGGIIGNCYGICTDFPNKYRAMF